MVPKSPLGNPIDDSTESNGLEWQELVPQLQVRWHGPSCAFPSACARHQIVGKHEDQAEEMEGQGTVLPWIHHEGLQPRQWSRAVCKVDFGTLYGQSHRPRILPLSSRRWEWKPFWVPRQRIAGSWWMWTSTRSPDLLKPCACWCFFLHGCCSDDCTSQCVCLEMRVSLDFWFAGTSFYRDAQCNSRRYNLLQSLHEALSMSRFLDITATGTRWTGNLIWLWIQLCDICIFNAEVWTTHLCGHLSGRAYTYLHGQCNVDGCLGKRGYESIPVCAKPSYWMRWDGREFIHEFTAYTG